MMADLQDINWAERILKAECMRGRVMKTNPSIPIEFFYQTIPYLSLWKIVV